uniref:Uncharacterized protein n=1 Tax=Nothobranchius furzeri TaxID=105023 RepID=A0A1A8UGW8_NOTFU
MSMENLVQDMEEIKKSLNFMSHEITKVAKQQSGLQEVLKEVKQLKALIQEKDKKIELLERRVDELEQHSRLDDLLISGLEIHRTYAQAAACDGGKDIEITATHSPGSPSLEDQVIKFFNSKDIAISSKDIVACHSLAQKHSKTSTIVIRLASRKCKMEVLRNAKKLKGTSVYVNEHLTKRNSEIARQARILRKEKKIHDTWTRNCKVLIKLNGPPEQAKVMVIRDIKELDQYK